MVMPVTCAIGPRDADAARGREFEESSPAIGIRVSGNTVVRRSMSGAMISVGGTPESDCSDDERSARVQPPIATGRSAPAIHGLTQGFTQLPGTRSVTPPPGKAKDP
ncbi:hypothetical protein [Streptomyces sp. NPDC059080]|uniref:hypothetical protein n=1 Tax=Streptomyces sp. NPDC059080 TaxID=3346718 RepID=UPI003688E0F2